MRGTGIPLATRAGVAADHARLAQGRPRRALVATALRTRSRHAREVLAELAWPGHSPADLDAWALEHPDGHDLPPGADPLGAADYGRVLVVQLGEEQDRRVGRHYLEAVARLPQWAEVRGEHVEVLMHSRLFGGDLDGARALAHDPRVREDVGEAVIADALNPALAPGADVAAWTEAFNAALHGPELAPILPPEPGQVPDLDRLRVEPRPAVDRPERITVMMSAYRRGRDLLTAARSVVAQTWTNWELFIVDDASGEGPQGCWAAVLEEAEALDPRIRVIRKAVNGGTYRARNTALRLATGDFAIVIDSDDWWHPQTLELCAGPLLAEPGLMATRSQGVRVTPDLVLSRVGYRPRFPSAPSVLFRLPETLSRIGFYDPTRKGADNEHARRMEASFGRVVRDIRQTTTFQRGGGQTLSSDEFGNGWRHPARHQYLTLYGDWHEQIALGGASAYLDPDEPRGVPEPLRWARATHPVLEHPRHLDLCVAGDWRRFGGPQRSMMQEIAAARQAGLRVGVMHLEALRFMGIRDLPLTPELVAMVRSGQVEWVLPDDDVDIDVLMVRYPPIMQYPPTVTSHVRARSVLVMANQAPLEADGSDQRYVVADVTERTRELFGAPVTWVPQSPTIRRILLEQDPDVALTPWDSPGLIDPDDWAVRPERVPGAGGRDIVVGRHSRDDRIKFPTSWAELTRGYTFPRGYQVRMLGGHGTVAELRQDAGVDHLPARWTVERNGSVDVREFLADLDFYLYLDNPEAYEAFGRSLLEAAASGVLTIAHPKHRPTFGDVLDYAEPGQAQELIARYVADPQAYAERVRRTQRLVRERFSPAAFVEHVRELLPAAPAAEPGPGRPPRSFALRPGRYGPGMSLGEDVVSSGEGEVLEVTRIPLRSTADGERADSLTVVHGGLGRAALRGWLRRHLELWTSTRWDTAGLLADAPAGVGAVLLRREGAVTALGRGTWTVQGDPAGPDELGPPPQDGWQQAAWWDRRPPHEVLLTVTGQEPVLAVQDSRRSVDGSA